MGLHDFTLYDVIVRNSRLFENQPAWLESGQEAPLTFGQIKTSVDRLALRLEEIGCRKGDRIGIIGSSCLTYFLLYGAAAALGAIIVPVNRRLSAHEAAYVLEDTSPRWIFADDDNPQWLDKVRGRLAAGLSFFNLRPGQGSLEEIGAAGAEKRELAASGVTGGDGFVIIHTAAVGGHPRGALLSHDNLICAHMHLMHAVGLQRSDVHLNVLPLFHVAGLLMTFCAFHAGCLNIVASKFDAAEAVELIARHKVSLMFTFAPILKSILDQQRRAKTAINSLRAVVGLEAPAEIEAYQAATSGCFYTIYGQSETSMLVSIAPYDQCPGAAGRPIPVARVDLLDDEEQPVPAGEVGEIVMRGPMVFQGYWNLPADNDHTFRNQWHHTGDLGRIDANGFLWYAGRKPDKELIKPGGENVYPAEVENAILAHPAVEAVVVFGVPHPKWKEGIKAVCTLKSGQRLAARELIEFVGSRIARYKKPQYVQFVDRLPIKDDGGLDRVKVKAMYGQ